MFDQCLMDPPWIFPQTHMLWGCRGSQWERSMKVEVQEQEGYDHNSKAENQPVKEEVEASECVDELCPTRAGGTLLVIQEDGCYLQQAV